jgi:hypothetical protein
MWTILVGRHVTIRRSKVLCGRPQSEVPAGRPHGLLRHAGTFAIRERPPGVCAKALGEFECGDAGRVVEIAETSCVAVVALWGIGVIR